jgi:hypothetical protein
MGQKDWLTNGGSRAVSLLMLPSRAVLANNAKQAVSADSATPCSAGQ